MRHIPLTLSINFVSLTQLTALTQLPSFKFSQYILKGFWSVFHHIPQVWELKLRTYYHLMREEKEPLWEDPSLARGGVWRIKCPKRETVSNHSNDPNKNFSFKVSTKSRYSVTAIVLLNYLPKEL